MRNKQTSALPDLWSRLGRLLLSWTTAVTAAGMLLYGMFVLLSAIFGDSGVAAALLISAAAAGGFAGSIQRRLLQSYWTVPVGWIGWTMAGWAVGLGLAVGLSVLLRPAVAALPDSYRLTVFLIAAGTAGAVSAFGTWRYLRRITFRHPWWLLANGVGWLMAWIVVLAFGLFLGGGEPLPASSDRLRDAVVLGAAAGFVIGFEQAVAVVGLLAQTAWERARGARPDQVQ